MKTFCGIIHFEFPWQPSIYVIMNSVVAARQRDRGEHCYRLSILETNQDGSRVVWPCLKAIVFEPLLRASTHTKVGWIAGCHGLPWLDHPAPLISLQEQSVCCMSLSWFIRLCKCCKAVSARRHSLCLPRLYTWCRCWTPPPADVREAFGKGVSDVVRPCWDQH